MTLASVRSRLAVRVGSLLTLDAGEWEEVDRNGVIVRVVHPPSRPMFDQIIEFLDAIADKEAPEPSFQEEGVAATVVCLRWGSYLSTILDSRKPLWPEGGEGIGARLSQSELDRINNEAAEALTSWIEIKRSDPLRYARLVAAALKLPFPVSTRNLRSDAHNPLPAFCHPELAAKLQGRLSTEAGRRARAEVASAPTRVLANAVVNYCWTREMFEDGATLPLDDSELPLTFRRIGSADEKELCRRVASGFARAFIGVGTLISEKGDRNWPDQVLPFNLLPDIGITPVGWRLSGGVSELYLVGPEPIA